MLLNGYSSILKFTKHIFFDSIDLRRNSLKTKEIGLLTLGVRAVEGSNPFAPTILGSIIKAHSQIGCEPFLLSKINFEMICLNFA